MYVVKQYDYRNIFNIMKSMADARATPANSLDEARKVILLSRKLELHREKNHSDFWQNFLKFKYKVAYTLENIFQNPRLFLVFILGRFNLVRFLYALAWRWRSQPKRASDRKSLFPHIEPDRIVDNLKKDGIYTDFSLPPKILVGLLHRAKSQDCYAGGNSDVGFNISQKHEVDLIYNKPFYVARYFNISSGWTEILQLASDPKIQEIADRYIGQPAKYTGASLFWTFPIRGTSQDSDQQKFSYFHYDLDDFASLRFCFYLTDVDEENGPHLCIRGSHLKKSIWDVLNFFTRIQSPEKLSKFYGTEKFVTLQGDSGTGFIEDTFCFHKGIPPKSKPRLFLQLHFAANNYSDTEYLDDRDPNSLKHFQPTSTILGVRG